MLKVSILNKKYRGSLAPTLGAISFTVKESETVSIFGASGCGKSTLLKIISGLDQAFDGEVTLDGSPVAASNSIGLVPQSPVCFEWLTIWENIAFGKRYIGVGAETTRRNVNDLRLIKEDALEMAEYVGLAKKELSKYPKEISGGMKQRMVLGRALLAGPRILLLDEPLSAVDQESREALRRLLENARQNLKIGLIAVSHDADEVLTLGDRTLFLGGQPAVIQETIESVFDVSTSNGLQRLQEQRERLRELLLADSGSYRELE